MHSLQVILPSLYLNHGHFVSHSVWHVWSYVFCFFVSIASKSLVSISVLSNVVVSVSADFSCSSVTAIVAGSVSVKFSWFTRFQLPLQALVNVRLNSHFPYGRDGACHCSGLYGDCSAGEIKVYFGRENAVFRHKLIGLNYFCTHNSPKTAPVWILLQSIWRTTHF